MLSNIVQEKLIFIFSGERDNKCSLRPLLRQKNISRVEHTALNSDQNIQVLI
jgi:hypothetical protein